MVKDSIKAIDPYPIKPILTAAILASAMVVPIAPFYQQLTDEIKPREFRNGHKRMSSDFAHHNKSPAPEGRSKRMDYALSSYNMI